MSIFLDNIKTEYEGELPFVRVKYEGAYNLAKTLDCGQCFRWERVNDDEWLGVAFGHLISVKQIDDELIIYNSTAEDFENIWCHYLALDEDYEKMFILSLCLLLTNDGADDSLIISLMYLLS